MAASFPSAIKTFTARSNGQTIDAAHVQDLQDEIHAVEDGLLNATADLVLGSTLTIGGQRYKWPTSAPSTGQVLTVASTSGSTNVLAWQAQTLSASVNYVQVKVKANLPIAAATATAISFLDENFDGNSIHSTAANPTRLTVPTGSSGIWSARASLRFLSDAVVSAVYLRKNGSDQLTNSFSASIGFPADHPISMLMSLDAADYVEVAAYSDSTNTISPASIFEMFRVS